MPRLHFTVRAHARRLRKARARQCWECVNPVTGEVVSRTTDPALCEQFGLIARPCPPDGEPPPPPRTAFSGTVRVQVGSNAPRPPRSGEVVITLLDLVSGDWVSRGVVATPDLSGRYSVTLTAPSALSWVFFRADHLSSGAMAGRRGLWHPDGTVDNWGALEVVDPGAEMPPDFSQDALLARQEVALINFPPVDVPVRRQTAPEGLGLGPVLLIGLVALVALQPSDRRRR